MTPTPVLAQRRHLWAFVLGCVAVTAGVALHVPMYLMGRDCGYRLAGMPMDIGMWWGMFLIVAGVVAAGWGLLPRAAGGTGVHHRVTVTAPEDTPLGPAHRRLLLVLTVALVIDVMKPATLGFVLPGMQIEYGVDHATVAWLPFAALCGTFTGSVAWGWLADVFGRRASILLSAVMFVGTSICGAMPSFWWNVGMCFMMGAAAGGMLPVAYALLAETMPSRSRGGALVLVGGLGAVGGYLAASGCAALFEPHYSWRFLWFLNLPTGLAIVLLNRLIPESPKFLVAQGRLREAHDLMVRFGATVTDEVVPDDAPATAVEPDTGTRTARVAPRLRAVTLALSLSGLAWGLANFGLLLWLPAALVAKGMDMRTTSELLARSALLALPTVFVAAWAYHAWSSKGALLASLGLTAAGVAGVASIEMGVTALSPVWAVALLVVGTSGVVAMLLPYAAESYPLRVRGRATGWVAACTKGGGIVAQGLGLLGLAPGLLSGAVIVAVPVAASLGLVAVFCGETRGRDLRDFEGGAGPQPGLAAD